MIQTKIQNQPQIFTIWSDKIGERLDPLYIKNTVFAKQESLKYPLVALRDLLKENPQYGANEVAINGNPIKDVRYIRITDIDEFGNLKNDNWKTAKKIDEKYLLKEGDVLFARSGATAGKTFIYNRKSGKAIFAGYLIRFRFDDKKVNPLFVFYCTQLKRYALWVKSIQRPSGQPNINSEEFKSFEIPLPSLEIQNQIISVMQKAYEQKTQKEAKTEQLLDSTHDYVLSELGIEMPKVKPQMIFIAVSDEMFGKRLDAEYNQEKYKTLQKAVGRGKYKTIEISKIICKDANKKYRINDEDKYIYIEIGNINKLTSVINLKEEKLGKGLPKGTKKKLSRNDIIISTVRPYLKGIARVNYEGENLISTGAFCVLRTQDNFNPDYLLEFVRSDIFVNLICQYMAGTTYPTVSIEDILGLAIPYPPIEIQNKIAEEARSRREKSKKLQQEAREILEQAKQKVEELIKK